MNPVLFQLGRLRLSTFGLFLLLAFWLGVSMTRRRSAATGIDANAMLDLSLYMIIAGILGGRIAYALVNFPAFAADPFAIFTVWRDGGLVFYGALAGGALVAWLAARRWRTAPTAVLDATAPGLALGYGLGMIGALMHSTPQTPLIMGKPTGVPWAVEIGFERIHPTQIYLMLAAIGIYFVSRSQREAAPGVPFLTFLFLQALSRFVVEFFVQSPLVLGPLTLAQLASAVVAVASVIALAVAGRRAQPIAPEPAYSDRNSEAQPVEQAAEERRGPL